MRFDIVTGANGYLGSYLVEYLLKQGRNVICVVRSPLKTDSKLCESLHCKILVCPLEKIEELPNLLPEGLLVDVCYHLAWHYGKKMQSSSVYEQVDYIQESMVYAITKDCTNKLLRLRARKYNLQYTWCRLCSIYGGGDKTGNLISYTVSCLKDGVSPEYGEGQQPYSFIHVEDCAEILGRIGMYCGNIPEQLTIAGPECKSVREYMQILRDVMQVETPLLFGKKEDDGIRYNADMFCNDWIVKTLGMQYRHPFAEEFRPA